VSSPVMLLRDDDHILLLQEGIAPQSLSLSNLTLKRLGGALGCGTIAPTADRSRLACAGRVAGLEILDATTGRSMHTLTTLSQKEIAAGEKAWETATQVNASNEAQKLRFHAEIYGDVFTSSDGHLALAVSRLAGVFQIWDLKENKRIGIGDLPSEQNAIGILPNGTVIAQLSDGECFRYENNKFRPLIEGTKTLAVAWDAKSLKLWVAEKDRIDLIDPTSSRLVETHPAPGIAGDLLVSPELGFIYRGTDYRLRRKSDATASPVVIEPQGANVTTGFRLSDRIVAGTWHVSHLEGKDAVHLINLGRDPKLPWVERRFDLGTHKGFDVIGLGGLNGATIRSATFSADGQFAAVSTAENVVLWQTNDGKRLATFPAADIVRFMKNGVLVAIKGDEVRRYETQTSRLISQKTVSTGLSFEQVLDEPKEGHLLVQRGNGLVPSLLNWRTGEIVKYAVFEQAIDDYEKVAGNAANDRYFVRILNDGSVLSADIAGAKGTTPTVRKMRIEGKPARVAVGGNRAAVVSSKGAITVFDLSTGKTLCRAGRGPSADVEIFVASEAPILAWLDVNRLEVRDLCGKAPRSFPAPSLIGDKTPVAISADGRRLLVLADQVEVWDLPQ
jgi:WD40 repeat protein